MKPYQITEILNLTPTPRGITSLNIDIHKANPSLSDFLKSYQNIQIQKHDIDRIKTDERLKAAELAIYNANEKILRGKQFIEKMLLHRNAFIEKMQISEDKMMKFIDKIPKILDATKFEELPLQELKEMIEQFKNTLLECYRSFTMINQSLWGIDNHYFHHSEWINEIQDILVQNKQPQNMLKFNLWEASQFFYNFFEKKNIALKKIYDLNQLEPAKRKMSSLSNISEQPQFVLSDEQIQNLIQYLEQFSLELQESAPGIEKLVCHLWMEDLIKVQELYQKNYFTLNNFIAQFGMKTDKLIYDIKVIEIKTSELRSTNDNVLRLLKRIIMPQLEANQNLNIMIQCQYKLTKSKKQIISLQKKLQDLYEDKLNIKMIRVVQPPENQYKPVGDIFRGPLCFERYDKQFLEKFIFQETSILSEELEDLAIETDGLVRMYTSLKDLLICEKKLKKSQVFFINCVNTYISNVQKIKEINDLKNISDSQLKTLMDEGLEIYQSQLKLSRSLNWLSYFNNSARILSKKLPLLGQFILTIDKFLDNGNLLMGQITQNMLPKYNAIYDEIAYRKKHNPQPQQEQSMFLEEEQPDSDDELMQIIRQQDFNQRVSNLGVKGITNRGKDQYRMSLIQSDNLSSQKQMIDLKSELLKSNAGNYRLENFQEYVPEEEDEDN